MNDVRIDQFSNGYYTIELVPQPYRSGPAVQSDVLHRVAETIATDEYCEPVFTFDLSGGVYFKPLSESAIPMDVIAVPEQYFDNGVLTDNNEAQTVFIPTCGTVNQLTR